MKKRIITLVLCLFVITLAFSGCDLDLEGMSISEPEVTYKIENGEAVAFRFPDESSVLEITILDEYEGVPVTKVADFCANNLENIHTIYIGKNVKEIGNWAFENNQKLQKFIVDEENPYFCSVDGVLFTKDMKTLLFYPVAKDVKEVKNEEGNTVKQSQYVVPDSVETIRTKAFYKCGYLTSITLPDSVRVIEEKAFFRCGSVTDFVLSENIEFIGKDAFAYCYGLTEITIPATIKEMGDYAFYNCTNLLTVNVEKAEKDVTLGEKWYPTNNGLDLDALKISWK